MSRAEEFLDLYRKLEAVVAANYGASREGGSIAKLGRRSEFRHIREELDYIRDVRNLLSHRPKISDDYMVEPSEAMLRLLEKVISQVECPAIARNIMVPVDKVISGTMEDKVLPALGRMYESAISNIPILEDGRICGVFSDSTFIQCTLSGKLQLGENTKFKEIREELRPESHKSEIFLFAEKATPVSELSDHFEEYGKDGKKVSMIFVTETGKPEEKLLGIITAWDVAAAY